MNKKLLILLSIIPALAACVSTPEPTDWIELDLTANTYYPESQQYKEAEFEIFVASFSALEYKIAMNKDDVIVYNLSAETTTPELLLIEFHGHTEPVEGEPGTVMFYKRHQNNQEEGSLVSPFDGIHGWYLKNDSEEDITVKLSVAGYFEEIDQ